MTDISDIDITMLDEAHPHSIKKFELIEAYVIAWSQKLINFSKCTGIIYIDCMCNSGFYRSEHGEIIEGTPIRVVKALNDVMSKHPDKKCWIYLNDIEPWKINILKTHLPQSPSNVQVKISAEDGNDLLRRIGTKLHFGQTASYLLVYDPFEAEIDWSAIVPFLHNWGEIILNHMVMDSSRAVKMAKHPETVEKYEKTYLTAIQNLISMSGDKNAFEDRIEEIIHSLRGSTKKYYIAAFPFMNSKNSIVYHLIHCTGNVKGFRLYKETAWKTFGGKSSLKKTHGTNKQLAMDFENLGEYSAKSDSHCYDLNDLIEYVKKCFKGKKNVTIAEIYALLDEHPVFPCDGYKHEIRNLLKKDPDVVVEKGNMYSF